MTPTVVGPTNSTRGRGRPRDPELDVQIMRSARGLLLSEGVRGFTLLEVARRAGVPKSTVYRRWANKREMLVAVMSEFASEPVALPDTGNLRDDLVILLGKAFESKTAIAALLSIGLEANVDPEIRPIVREALDNRRRALYPVLQQGVDRGELRSDVDFDSVLHQVYGTIWSRVVSQRDELDRLGIEGLVDRALQGLST